MESKIHSPKGPVNNQANFDKQGGANGTREKVGTRIESVQIPEISLPKGGGALKGIDEKFEVNAANGTAGFSIPLPASPGRNGFSPALSLNYNSGSGNSPFGLGWALAHAGIQRKTDKKLPRYREGSAEDVFMFSGVEDLVPFLEEESMTSGFREKKETTGDGYTVERYRPRLEGGFTRIEKIHHQLHDVYWKVTTGSNVATIFGRNPQARIADSQDALHIFQWLPEFSYDDKGNWIRYHYKNDSNRNADGSVLIDESIPNSVFEKNRKSGLASFTNTYLKRITYGNRIPYFANPAKPYDPQLPEDQEYFFELVMDYGEHDELNPTPNDTGLWNYREDAFSSYRSGFEIRTNRLCKRILMFHHFTGEKQFVGTPDEADFGANYLVRSLDLEYEPSSINGSGQAEVNYLKTITQRGYIRKADNSYSQKSLPPMEFTYEKLNWNKDIRTVNVENIANAPVGLTNNYQWVDLYGEGISGILTEQGGGWYYKNNLGSPDEDGAVHFTSAQKVIPKPSFTGLSQGVLSIQDLAGNGEKQLVANTRGINGYFELAAGKNWKSFQPFEQWANINLQDPNLRLIDLNGDGLPELALTEENVFVWYPSDGKRGHLPAESLSRTFDEEQGPAIVFADTSQSIFLADMSGDGLTDIVRIRNGEVCYWANKGYGSFSARITMDNAPYFDYSDTFNPEYLHLADVSGTGATDLIYLGENSFKAFINLSGNAWSKAHEIEPFMPIDGNCKLSVIDLLGTGTSCIVWSSDLPAYDHAPMRYIDLMDSKKPHVLTHYKNNMGKETSVEYKSSTHFYLKDQLDGRPWITKLPFPVQVIQKITVAEKITDVRFSSEYRYHHGYYDHTEREFRGFGMVEQLDTEYYPGWRANNEGNLPMAIGMEPSEELYQPPVLTKTWFHTGAFLDNKKLLTHFKAEYWMEEFNRKFPNSKITIKEPELDDAQVVAAKTLLDPSVINRLNGDEWREALRSCKGMVLRQEVFALDGKKGDMASLYKEAKPYNVATHNCHIQLLQPRGNNPFAVFMVTESEALSIQYERDETNPRMSHTLTTKIDDLGQILEAASVVYPRKLADMDLPPEIRAKQARTHIIYTQNRFTNDVILPHAYRLRTMAEANTFEITGLEPSTVFYRLVNFEEILTTASTEIAYQETATSGNVQRRLIEQIRSLYYRDDLTGPLPTGILESLGLGHENYQLVYTPGLLQDIFGNKITNADAMMEEGRFFKQDGNWWVRSGTSQLIDVSVGETATDAQNRFYSPVAHTDPFGAITRVAYYKDYFLMAQSTTDAVGNLASVEKYNFRTLSPILMKDINDNLSGVLLDELGLVKAMAVMGKGNEADDLQGLSENTSEEEEAHIKEYFTLSGTSALHTIARQLLQQATVRYLYDIDRYQASVMLREEQLMDDPNTQPCAVVKLLPAVVGRIMRELHHQINPESPLQLSFEYSSGLGQVAMIKSQAEPGEALQLNIQPNCNYSLETVDTASTGQLRWIGNGRTVLNNKGNPVKQYEPYFSVNPFYEDAKELVERGVTPIIYYDAAGRNIRTELPNGTLTKVEFDAWSQRSYDQNDTVMESQWYAERGSPDPDATAPTNPPQLAAWKAAQHYHTPSEVHLDSLGRPVFSIAHNRVAGVDEFYATTIHIDIEGNTRSVVDARGNTVMAYKYDLLGSQVYQNSMDAGERWMLGNVAGNPLRAWDSRNHILFTQYDALQRPLELRVQGGDGDSPLNNVFSKTIYGEGQTDDKANNLRGKILYQYDTAGKVSSVRFDFKGNLLEGNRRLAIDYKKVPDWAGVDPDTALELETFDSAVNYDALNRVISNTTPDGSVTLPGYNEAGLLETIQVQLAAVGNASPQTRTFVQNIDYNEKRQRQRILYGNNVQTTYTYDPLTFRLIKLQSRKLNNELLQDLLYTYDPIGNISEIEDLAVPTIFFANNQIEPKSRYTYDALYRLIEAVGREHRGQLNEMSEDNWNDLPFLKQYSPNNEMALRNYTQSYQYDGVGNIMQMKHVANGGSWTRDYAYETNNNRLQNTTVGNQTYTYTHHPAHGYITQMPHLPIMQWNFKDELKASSRGVVNNGIPETTHYVYDGGGQRVRKVTENEGGSAKKDERIYLGGVEVYRKHNGTNAGLERVTLHVMDDSIRIAMVDTRNEVNDDSDRRTVRYELGNHLGSAALELTGDTNPTVISYEEYHPYGTTAYQAINAAIQVAVKRYRYTGMERDEETGLSYHSARYYLPWLGRWTGVDPIGIQDGLNMYSYVNGNPILFLDPGGSRTTTPAQSFSELKKSTEYQNLEDPLKKDLDSIIGRFTKKKLSKEEESKHAERLHILLSIPDPASEKSKPTIAERVKEVEFVAKQQKITEKSSYLAQQEDKKFKGKLGKEEELSKNANFTPPKTTSDGQIYEVDASDPKNIHVRITIKLKAARTGERGKLDEFLIKSQENAIERMAAETEGFTLDVVFVDSNYSGNNANEVKIDFRKAVDAGNFGGRTASLLHELGHHMGLEDRYNYFVHHENTGMTRKDRLYWYNEQIDRTYSKRRGVMNDSQKNTKFLPSELKEIAR